MPTPTQVVPSAYRTTIDYAYDPLYRLTSANYTGAHYVGACPEGLPQSIEGMEGTTRIA